jgi:glycosyltransferase involved in cell wall biosynthesis
MPPGRVTLVVGTVAGGTGTHIRMLAEGLAGRGITVSVAGPSSADSRFSFSALPAVSFCAVEIGKRPRAGDLRALSRLRRLLTRPAGSGGGGPSGEGQVAHAHGLRAGALTVLALLGARRRPAIVVSVHNAPPPGRGAAGIVYRVLERVAARGADLVLCVSPDLEARMRAAGARRVGPAVIAAPAAGPEAAVTGPATAFPGAGAPGREPDAVAGATITAEARPVVLAVGRLAAQKGFAALLDAAVTWRDLDPRPLVVFAGEGPLATELRARAIALDVAAVFCGHVGDVPALLAKAAVLVMPSQWEGQPLVLQEALRAGVPVVATRVGGIPALTGEDAALLVPPGDARALAAAVRSVLCDPALAARLRAAAAGRAAARPAPADALRAVLASYAAAGR